MKSKVFIFCATLILVSSLSVIGCAKPAPTPAPTPAPAPAPAPAPTPAPAPAPAPVKATKLTFANWLPPMNPLSVTYDIWARDFEKNTGGRYTVEVIHGGALAGMTESYDVLIRGIADISQFIPTELEKPFPLSNVPGLPFGPCLSLTATQAWHEVFNKGYLDNEFADVKIIMFTGGVGDELLTKEPINSVADMKGVKVLTGGGALKVELTKLLGGVPVMGGPPDVYPMLEKGIVDGVFMSGLGLKEFQWAKYLKYLINPLRMGRVVNTVAMNKDVYSKMPDDVKAIINEMDADGKYSFMSAQKFGDFYEECWDYFYEVGGKAIDWNPDQKAELDKIIAPIWVDWIAEHKTQGLPAKKVIDEFYYALQKFGIADPAIGYTPGG